MVSVLAKAVLVVVANLGISTETRCAVVYAARVLGALASAAFAYLALTMILVVNLLWDAYQEDDTDCRQRHRWITAIRATSC